MDIRAAVQAWMREQGIRDPGALDAGDYAKVKTLLSSDRPAFGIFWSLIMFDRQNWAIQLQNADLGSELGRSAASRLQGAIGAIDAVRDLLLNIADPVGDGSEASQ